jgi:hypothetical protein
MSLADAKCCFQVSSRTEGLYSLIVSLLNWPSRGLILLIKIHSCISFEEYYFSLLHMHIRSVHANPTRCIYSLIKVVLFLICY